MHILKNIIVWVTALVLMPIHILKLIKRMDSVNKKIENIEKIEKIGKIEKIDSNISAISSLLILKEINPEIVKQLIPSLPLPADVLSWDVHQRYKREKNIMALEDMVASQIFSIANGCKSLPWRLLRTYEDIALNTASVLAKPALFGLPMEHALVAARNIPVTLKLGELFETFDKKITREARFRHIWKLYIAALLAAGNDDKALNLLYFYATRYDLRDLENLLAVAHFAHANSLSNGHIENSARLYDQFKKNFGALEALVAGKSVAVVGAGPYEVGQGRGHEIDSHDLVIRFSNSARVEDKHQPDYGSRTDINVWTPFIDSVAPNQLQVLREATFIYFPYCMDTQPFPMVCVNTLSHCIKNNHAVVAATPGTFFTELVNGPLAELDIGINVSTGARLLAYLKQIMGNRLTLDNIFGFAFKYAATDFSWDTPYHYAHDNFGNLTSLRSILPGHAHNFLQEARLLRRLFGMENDSVGTEDHS